MSSFDEYIEAHNAAVRSGDWEAFSRWFTDGASAGITTVTGRPAAAP